MILAHIFLPAMLIVICKSHSSPQFNDQLTVEKSPDLYSFTGPSGVDLSPTNNNEELLDNYRQFVAKSLIKLHDFCRVYNFLQSIKFNLNGKSSNNNSFNILESRGGNTKNAVNFLLIEIFAPYLIVYFIHRVKMGYLYYKVKYGKA